MLLNRRQSIGQLVTLAGIAAAGTVQAQQSCAVFTKETLAGLSPDDALQRLKDGNARFVAGKTVNCDLLKQVRDTATGQAPFAAVVGCMDSRVPPELVFDQRIGDIFSARIAGNFVNTDIIGSLEYATAAVGSKLIVILGHSDCGAIKGTVDNVKLGNLTATLANIRPSLDKLNYQGVPSSKDKALVQKVADQNARDAAAAILTRSDVIAQQVKDGKVKIVSAMHDVATGQISWFA